MSDGKRIIFEDLFANFDVLRYGEFRPLHPGVEILPLYGFDEHARPVSKGQAAAALLRYAPGAEVPQHEHTGYEHIFVLRGSQSDAAGTYQAGACVVNPPGTRHSVRSEGGCLVLAIWNRPVEVLS